MAQSNKTFQAIGKTSGDVTNSQIIIPGDNSPSKKQNVTIDYICITASAGSTFQLVNGADHTQITPAYDIGTASGPFIINVTDVEVWESLPGQGVDLTTTGGGNVAYTIAYHYAP